MLGGANNLTREILRAHMCDPASVQAHLLQDAVTERWQPIKPSKTPSFDQGYTTVLQVQDIHYRESLHAHTFGISC